MEQSQHQMVLVQTHPTGADEWLCPECGRRFLLQYPPNYKKIILVPGDEYASHSGGKGGIVMGGVQAGGPPAESAAHDMEQPRATDVAEAEPDVQLDDEALRPWRDLFDDLDRDEAA